MRTTLKKIRAVNPCREGWMKLLKHLGKTKADNESLELRTILESNGVDDALWCVRTLDKRDRVQIALAYANSVKHLMTDAAALRALEVCEQYVAGTASDKELRAAAIDATDAAHAAVAAAVRAAAYAAAYAAVAADARVAAYDAATINAFKTKILLKVLYK